MKILSAVAMAALLASSAAYSAEMMSSVPSSSKTVTDWYKQDIYDPSNSKIGKIDDVLVSDIGQVNALVIGVGEEEKKTDCSVDQNRRSRGQSASTGCIAERKNAPGWTIQGTLCPFASGAFLFARFGLKCGEAEATGTNFVRSSCEGR
jgi:hypothetical protein